MTPRGIKSEKAVMLLQSGEFLREVEADLAAFDVSHFGLDHFQSANEETLYGQYVSTARRLQIANDTATRAQFLVDEIAEKMLDAKTDAEWRRLLWERNAERRRRDTAKRQAEHLEETARALRAKLPDMRDDRVRYQLDAELYASRLRRCLFEAVLSGKSPAGFFSSSSKLPNSHKREFLELMTPRLIDGQPETREQVADRIVAAARQWYLQDRTERFLTADRSELLGASRLNGYIDDAKPEPMEWR